MSTSAPRRTVDTIDRRVGLMFGIFGLLLLVGVVRAGYLATIKSAALRHAANSQQVSNTVVPAPRGEITDRDGVIYAISEPSDSIYIDPIQVGKAYPRPQQVAYKLAPLLNLTVDRTLALITKPNTGYVQLATNIPAATAATIMKLQVTPTSAPGINGLWEVPTERRAYPRGSELGQVLGWVGTDGAGSVGLEWKFNKLLGGVNGSRRTVIDAQGKAINVETPKAMVPGENVKLTISAPLQAEVEQVLAGVGAQYKPAGATAIVTDPQTNQILALANWPSLNLDKIPSSVYQSLNGQVPASEDQAVDMSYEPGSTFKAVTVAAALQDGKVTPDTVISVPPYLEAPGNPSPYKVSDAEPHGYEQLTVAKILEVSSNIGADLIGQKMTGARFGYWVNRFGFGKPTGIDLPGEQRGIILQPSNYTGSSMFNLPFGQGESVTPMQMVQAYDAIANGGILRTPQIVASIGGKSQTEPAGKRIISAEVASELRTMLRGPLTDQGTASGAAIKGYDMAGKTGTAQVADKGGYSKTKFIASFIGMVPATDPKLVVAVVVNQPQGAIFGGSVAAPAFQKIVGWAVPHFGINPCPAANCSGSSTG